MSDREKEILLKILAHINSIERYILPVSSLEELENDTMRFEAVIFNLMQIGELVFQKVTPEMQDRLTTIPWKNIKGMRHRIVHGYDDIDNNIVWITITKDIPRLKTSIKNALT